MAVPTVRQTIRVRLVSLTVLATVLAYGLVIGTFLELVPIYPTISLETSTRLSHLVAAANVATVSCLAAGWWAIRSNRVRLHRKLMLSATGFITIFLVLYLLRVGGGGTKHFVGPALVETAYLGMLAVHILLSIVAVPIVIYVLLIGLSRPPAEVRTTSHARIGRVAAGTWIISLVLGLITYVLLEHVYTWEYVT